MKKLASVLSTIPLCVGFALAQDAATTPQATSGNMENAGKPMVGILVDASCSNSMPRSTASSMSKTTPNDSMANRSTPAQSGRDWNSTDKNTAGAADRVNSGAPGARDMNRATASSATGTTDVGRNTGGADDMAQHTSQSVKGGLGDVATASKNNNGNWDKTCFISTKSTSYVLQLQDGKMLRLDDAANSKVTSQLQSTGRVSKASKVFRVKVTGTMEGDTLHVIDIQM